MGNVAVAGPHGAGALAVGPCASANASVSNNTVTDSYNTTTNKTDNSETSGIRNVTFGNVDGGIRFTRSAPLRSAPPLLASAAPPLASAPPPHASSNNITVANASANPVKLYCSSAQMPTSSLIQGDSLLTPPDVRSLDIPPSEHASYPIEEDLYVTVFRVSEQLHCPDGKQLLENYLVEKHSARSCIITDGGVKMAKEGEIWTDDDGTDYHPGGGN